MNEAIRIDGDGDVSAEKQEIAGLDFVAFDPPAGVDLIFGVSRQIDAECLI